MNRTVTHSLIGGTFVAASVLLLVFASQAHQEYGKAHAAADRAMRAMDATAELSTLPDSLVLPEPFFRQAQWYAGGACALGAIALIAAIRTRHLAWLACFIACGVLATVAVIKAGVRY